MSIKFNDMEHITLPELLKAICKKNPDKKGLIFDENFYTYKDFYRKVNALSANLINLGVSPNDRVALILPDSIDYMISYFSLFQIGAWAVPISNYWNEDEITSILIDSRVSVVIFVEQQGIVNYVDIITDIQKELPILKKLILVNNPNKCEEIGAINFNDLIRRKIDIEIISNVLPDDVAIVAYSSGTTGKPKGVMLTHENIVKTSIHTAQQWKMTENDKPLSIAPLCSVEGFLLALLFLSSCSSVKYLTTFNINTIVKSASKDVNTVIFTKPLMWAIVLDIPSINFAKFYLYNNIVVFGSICSPDLTKRIEESTKCPVYNAYGLVEATGIVTMTREGDSEEIRLNTVGRPIPGVEIKIVNDNRIEVSKGKIGELAVKGYVMKGYLDNTEKTKRVIDENGWLYTGDLAKYYDEENISIVGRCEDIIIREGTKVYPIDIEEVIMRYPNVYDVAVVGRDNIKLGEEIVAFVIPKPGELLNKNMILKYCADRIKYSSIPDDIIFISQMPMTFSGKVQRKVLKQWAQEGTPEKVLMLFNEMKGE